MRKIALLSTVGAMLVAMLSGSPAQALNFRSWVASYGSGTTCTRGSPCGTFQAAHDATSAGGEINCVDAGEFNPGFALTITKSITIDCGGGFGATTFDDLTISGDGIVVRLRNISLQGGGSGIGSAAVNFINGSALYVENCAIFGWQGGTGVGIRFTPPDGVAAKLFVTDSIISNNGVAAGGGGIIIQPAGTGSARVMIERTHVENNTYGIYAIGSGSTGAIIVHVKDSVVANNVLNGVSAFTTAGQATVSVTLDHSSSVLNGADGILAQGPSAYVVLGNSTVMSNTTGLHSLGGTILSYQNNQLAGNMTDGAPGTVLSVR